MTTYTRRLVAGVSGVFLGALAACSNALEVRLPGVVTEEALNNPLNASALANGVILDFECAWSNYVVATNALSDQLINSNTIANFLPWYLRQVLPETAALIGTCEVAQGYFPYAPLQITRRGAERAATLIREFNEAGVPNKNQLVATVNAYGGYAALALGEGFCEAVVEPGTVGTTRAMLQEAERFFTQALTFTGAPADIRNMALVGRARARLDLENFAGAIADASLVPRGFVKQATRGSGEKQRWNLVFEFQNNTANRVFAVGSVAPKFRNLTVDGVPDPRPGVGAQNGTGNDQITPFFPHNKATARNSALPIATYADARAVWAEAAVRSGDLARARQLINEMRTDAGLPPYDPGGVATQSQIVAQVIEERSRELFLMGGHRLNDMLRFRSTPFRIPFRGEAGSDHPTGRDHRGLDYGPTTCIPLPLAEAL